MLREKKEISKTGAFNDFVKSQKSLASDMLSYIFKNE